MNFESFLPLLLIITPFVIAFILEAGVIYFFKLTKFWTAVFLSIVINLISLIIIVYGASPLLSLLGYEISGLHLQLPVIFFLWWFSSVIDGALLSLLVKQAEKKQLLTASLAMNSLSFLFLYFFVMNSHS